MIFSILFGLGKTSTMTKVSHASHSPSIFTPVAALPLPSVVTTAFILLLDLSHTVLSELQGHPLLMLSAVVLSPVHPRFVLVHTPCSSMPVLRTQECCFTYYNWLILNATWTDNTHKETNVLPSNRWDEDSRQQVNFLGKRGSRWYYSYS